MDLCAESHSEPSNYLIPSFGFYLFLRFNSVFSHLYTVGRGRPVTLDLNRVLTLANKSQSIGLELTLYPILTSKSNPPTQTKSQPSEVCKYKGMAPYLFK